MVWAALAGSRLGACGGSSGSSPTARSSSASCVLVPANDLADDASVDDAIERLCLLAKVEKGIAQLDAGQSLDHDEVKRRFGL